MSMSSGDGMWCTFCIESDTLNILNRPEWEDEYKFACDLLGTLEDPSFTKIPLCDECLLTFRHLSALRQQIIEVKQQLKQRVQNSEHIADKTGEGGDEIIRTQVRAFRKGVLEGGDDLLAKNTFRSLDKRKLTQRGNKSRRREVDEDALVKMETNYWNWANNDGNGDFSDNCGDDNYFTGGNLQERITLQRTNSTEEELTCSHCSENFASKGQLRTHIRRTHTEKQCHKCPHCPYTSDSIKSCRKHVLEIHPGEEKFRPFICDKCGASFTTHSILKNHMKIHTRGTDKPFLCHSCTFSTHTKGALNEHINFLHNPAFKKFQCYFCSRKCNRLDYLNKHMMKHTGEKPFKCGRCDFASTTAWNIKAHLKTVHKNDAEEEEGRTIQCPQCPGKFRSQRSLLWHTNSSHSTSLKCPFPNCTFEALTRSTLKQHVEDNHPKGELNWPCSECPKRFQTQQNLQRHFKTNHQGQNSIGARAAQFSQQETTSTGNYYSPYNNFQLPSAMSYLHYQNNPHNMTANHQLQYQQHEELLNHFIWPQQQ